MVACMPFQDHLLGPRMYNKTVQAPVGLSLGAVICHLHSCANGKSPLPVG